MTGRVAVPSRQQRCSSEPLYALAVKTGGLEATGTCDLTTVGRRSGHLRHVEIWYVSVDGQMVVTGTPGTRDWLANLRACPQAVLHLRDPVRAVEVVATEVVDPVKRRHITTEAFRLQPWYASQRYSVEDWVAGAPMVALTAADRET